MIDKTRKGEYTFDEISGASSAEDFTEMLKHNKRLDGWVEEVKPVFVDEGLTLRDRYLEPPFSVLDAKSGSWRKRKDAWLEMGIKSEVGRDAECLPGKSNNDYMPDMASGTSIFDPALCELMYKWFCPDGGKILDPFAGGSVRGIVAHKLGYKYVGIELRPEQVESNRQQAMELLPADNQPTWICGDSEKILDTLVTGSRFDYMPEFDFIFSCPPYLNLEVYSDLDDDLSRMDYKPFMEKYSSIIKKAFFLLKNDSFVVWVVGDVREARGYYLDFIGETKKAFMNMEVGAKLYNDMILLDPIGTAMIRARNTFKEKKVVKVHQNVLCFKKI